MFIEIMFDMYKILNDIEQAYRYAENNRRHSCIETISDLI